MQLAGLLRAARFPIIGAALRERQHLQRRLAQLFGRDDGVDGMNLQRRVGLLRLAASDPFDRVVGTHQAREAHGAPEAREDAELHFRKAHLRLRSHHAVVGAQRHLEATAERDAVDRRDARKRQVLDRREHLVDLDRPLRDLFLGLQEALAELGDVGADDERILAAGNDQALDLAVGGDRGGSGAQFHDGGGVELVDRFVLAVEFQLGNVAVEPDDLDGLALIHGAVILVGE